MYRVSDHGALGGVSDLVTDVMASIKRGHPESPTGLRNLIRGSAQLIETPRQLFWRNAIRLAGHNPN